MRLLIQHEAALKACPTECTPKAIADKLPAGLNPEGNGTILRSFTRSGRIISVLDKEALFASKGGRLMVGPTLAAWARLTKESTRAGVWVLDEKKREGIRPNKGLLIVTTLDKPTSYGSPAIID
jgi:hypothetical protein